MYTQNCISVYSNEIGCFLQGRTGMKNENLIQEINELHADICSALADPTRILILYTLSEQRLSVTELAASLGISQPAASRHLKVLRERGLVSAARQGPRVEYSLVDLRLIEALNILRTLLRDRIAYRAELMDVETSLREQK
jgi:ArsR family transcriptional regulator